MGSETNMRTFTTLSLALLATAAVAAGAYAAEETNQSPEHPALAQQVAN